MLDMSREANSKLEGGHCCNHRVVGSSHFTYHVTIKINK